MSQPATEPPAGGAPGGGNLLTRRFGGVPGYVFLLLAGGIGVGVYLYKRNQSSSSSSAAAAPATTTAQCEDANGSPVDCNSPLAVNSNGQSEYEQLTSQLTGISGQDAALLAAIQQQQGSSSGGTTTTTTTPPPGQTVAVPNVVGSRAVPARTTITKAGLNPVFVPPIMAKYEWQVTGQTPAGGAKVAPGSTVTVNIKRI